MIRCIALTVRNIKKIWRGPKMVTGRYTERCPRCGGDMTLEHSGSRDEATAEDAYWKCVDCHKIVDYEYFE